MSKAKIRTIAIVLGDNDFGHTFINLLDSIYKAIEYGSVTIQDKKEEQIRDITYAIKNGIRYHYITFQLLSYGGNVSENMLERTLKYLESIRILFDEDAEKDIVEKDHDGGAWYLEVQTGKVYGY
jgi:hypothetical protein